MFFKKTHIAAAINQHSIRFAVVSGRGTSVCLEKASYRPFPEGTLRMSFQEPNVVDPKIFSDTVSQAFTMTLNSSSNISVSLPDTVGRVLRLDLETRFKSRAEGLDIIQWKLKKNISLAPDDVNLDYQLLKVRENGEMAVLVSVTSRAVITQYEELLLEIGLTPSRIELETLSLCRTCFQMVNDVGNYGIITLFSDSLGILLFCDGIPELIRIKNIVGKSGDGRIQAEIRNSVLTYKERFEEPGLTKLFCIASPEVIRELSDMLCEITELKPSFVDIKSFAKTSADVPSDQSSLFPYTAAIGAAMRGLI